MNRLPESGLSIISQFEFVHREDPRPGRRSRLEVQPPSSQRSPMRNLNVSSWNGALTTLLGLVVVSVVAVGIRLLLMQTIQRRRERENRQINERLRTLIAAYKVLGGSFTGELSVDPAHLRAMRPTSINVSPVNEPVDGTLRENHLKMPSPYTIFPPANVSTLSITRMASASTAKQSLDNAAKPANMP